MIRIDSNEKVTHCGNSVAGACREIGNGILITPIGVGVDERAVDFSNRRPDNRCGVKWHRGPGAADNGASEWTEGEVAMKGASDVDSRSGQGGRTVADTAIRISCKERGVIATTCVDSAAGTSRQRGNAARVVLVRGDIGGVVDLGGSTDLSVSRACIRVRARNGAGENDGAVVALSSRRTSNGCGVEIRGEQGPTDRGAGEWMGVVVTVEAAIRADCAETTSSVHSGACPENESTANIDLYSGRPDEGCGVAGLRM